MVTSCAKTKYLMEQGLGQLRLQRNAINNELVLQDPEVPTKYKEKIRKIESYKKYFLTTFKDGSEQIYSKTTFLKGKAVTNLVIASKYYEIKAKKECFLFMGCFPYLGFFNEKSAIKYQKELEQDEYVTWKRPVYAYSTLGYFTDNILSSFFVYKDFQLAEMIFHELFHTIFFIKNEVDLNESLASFFGREMARAYYKKDEGDIGKMKREQRSKQLLRSSIVQLVQRLKKRYGKIKGKDRKDFSRELTRFLQNDFRPQIKKECQRLKVSENRCYPLHRQWNNASFSAFLTYEKDSRFIQQLYKKKQVDLRSFYLYLKNEYDSYDRGRYKTFDLYLKSQL